MAKPAQTDVPPAPAAEPRRTIAEWGKAKAVEPHLVAAVRAFLGADDLLAVTEGQFDAALAAFTGATLSQPSPR